MVKLLALLSLLLLFVSCDEVNRHEEPDVGILTERCAIPTYAAIDAISCPIGNQTLWIIASFAGLTDLWTIVPDNYAYLSDTDLCGELESASHDTANYFRFIPLTDEEQAFNDTSHSGYYGLWPIGAVATSENDAYIYYNKVLIRGFFEVEVIGTGIAHVNSEFEVTRLILEGNQPDYSIYWAYPRAGWGEGAMLGNDGYVYLFRNSQVDLLGWETRTARVLPENIGNPSAYEYYAGFDVWDSHEDRAGIVLRDCSSISMSWNEHLGRYVQIYSRGDAVVISAAGQPWEEWSDPLPLFHDAEAVGFFDISGVAVHPESNGFSNKILKISYLDHSRIESVEFELEEK